MKVWDEFKWEFWDPKKNPLPEIPKKYRKISICTTCMGRTHDLKKTFIKNLCDNQDYPNVEFVLLNYNSRDDMDEWVHKYLSGWMQDGIVKYVKTDKPQYYSMGKSRNIAFKQATGDIVTNVDADNFTGEGFAGFLNLLAEVQPEKALFAKGKRGMHGRIGMYKNEFIEIGGYDEDLQGYGYDDHSVVLRAMSHFNAKFMWWAGVSKIDFTKRIKTPRGVVGKNMENQNWRHTEKANKEITLKKMRSGEFIVNQGREWGLV